MPLNFKPLYFLSLRISIKSFYLLFQYPGDKRCGNGTSDSVVVDLHELFCIK